MTAPLIIAHRGLPKSTPENTLPSYLAALKHRPDVVECDYRHSRDGKLIVIHDEKLDRTTDAETVFGRKECLIGEFDAKDLERLDAGSWYKTPFPGTRLPTLEAVIDAVCPHAKLMIERKDGDAATLVELIRRKNVFDRVVVQAFHWPFLEDCHLLEPRLKLGGLGKHELTAREIDEAKRIGATLLGWDQRDLTPEGIKLAHDAGFDVWSWTVNDPQRARDLVAAGLDGIITDRCDVVREWLKSQ